MKKTSLMLAIAALLYGTSSTYVFAYEIDDSLWNDMDKLENILEKNCKDKDVDIDVPADLDVKENEVVDITAASQPPPPPNIFVDDDDLIKVGSFCGFSPTGANMADFPVDIDGPDGADSATFKVLGTDSGIAIGNGWLLYQSGDTWDQKWCFVAERKIDTVTVDPISRQGSIRYAFDVIFLPTHSDEPNTGSQKGWAITGKKASFTATYSHPVLVGNHINHLAGGLNNLSALWDDYLNNLQNNVNELPPHDMYGTLTIEFDEPLIGTIDLGKHFIFRADTDCLPVTNVIAESYQGGQLTFTLTMTAGGSAYVAERCGNDASNRVSEIFSVDKGEGAVEFSAPLTLQSGCYYSMVELDDSGNTIGNIHVDGITLNDNNEYYAE